LPGNSLAAMTNIKSQMENGKCYVSDQGDIRTRS
jgi:hypothetical protein